MLNDINDAASLDTGNDVKAKGILMGFFNQMLKNSSADACMPTSLPSAPRGRVQIIAIGKAAAAMAAKALNDIDGPISCLVITRYGHVLPSISLPDHVEIIEAGHPVPDESSVKAASRALELSHKLGPHDHMLALISGGGSALLSQAVDGVSLAEKRDVTRQLLKSGATIAEINCVRKHLSRIKGGRLALAAAPAKVTTLLISDVPGDDPSFVASGPTVADSTTLDDARQIITRYGISVSDSIATALTDPANETPEADELGLAGNEIRIIATARGALQSVSLHAAEQGFKVTNLGDHLQSEARYLGANHAELARRQAGDGIKCLIISGGETTVTVTGEDGRGGRNLEYLLGMAIALDRQPGIYALACDTDGIDGTEDNAGAIITPTTLKRASAIGLSAADHLAANNAYGFFKALDDLIITGPTMTNVNDFRAILIDKDMT